MRTIIALAMLFILNFNSSSLSFDGGVKQLVWMTSVRLPSKIYRLRCSGCFVVSVSTAAATHFVFEVFDKLEISIIAKINGNQYAPLYIMSSFIISQEFSSKGHTGFEDGDEW